MSDSNESTEPVCLTDFDSFKSVSVNSIRITIMCRDSCSSNHVWGVMLRLSQTPPYSKIQMKVETLQRSPFLPFVVFKNLKRHQLSWIHPFFYISLMRKSNFSTSSQSENFFARSGFECWNFPSRNWMHILKLCKKTVG